jgi:hypothetical protein
MSLKLNDNIIEEVKWFRYLRSGVDGNKGIERDVVVWIAKAQTAFVMLDNIWRERMVSTRTKIRIFNANVKNILLYGSGTWRTTKHLLYKFLYKCS